MWRNRNFTPDDFKTFLLRNENKLSYISWYHGFETFDSSNTVTDFIYGTWNGDLSDFIYYWKDDCIRTRVNIEKSTGMISVVIRDHDSEHRVTDINDCDDISSGITAPW